MRRIMIARKIKLCRMLCVAGFILTIFSCVSQRAEQNMNPIQAAITGLSRVSMTTWDSLSQKKIFFGHQSVGYNILEGIKDIEKQAPQVRLSIRATRDPGDYLRPIFGESPIGKNGSPESKIDDFRHVMESGLGAQVDIAFFKICFVDINRKTNVPALFGYYKSAMDTLAKEFPKVRFINCTAPLTTIDSGFKLLLKNLLGKDGGVVANLKRREYNNLIVETYGAAGNVFDIARAESTYPDGTRMLIRDGGKDCYGLVSGYTNDGGHLNQTGRVVVAAALLETLAAVGR